MSVSAHEHARARARRFAIEQDHGYTVRWTDRSGRARGAIESRYDGIGLARDLASNGADDVRLITPDGEVITDIAGLVY